MTTTRTGNVNSVPATGAVAIFNVKTLLKAAGWTVPRSSDGTTYNSSGDQITTGAAGAGGMANNLAWFVIQDPGGRRQYMFQRSTTNRIWTIRFSESAKFTGGTPNATTPATATDSQTLFSALTLFDADGTYRFHTVTDPVAIPGSNVYMFWFAAHTTGQAVCQTLFVADGMRTGTYHPQDVSPLIHYCNYLTGTTSTGGAIFHNSFGNSPPAAYTTAWLAYGLGAQGYVAVTLSRCGSINRAWPSNNGAGPSPLTAEDPLIEIFVGRPFSQSAPTGPKGTLASMRHTGASRSYPTTINLSSDPYVVMGALLGTVEASACSVALPWVTGSAPTL